jgi:acetyl-CoA acetyltransferase
VTSFRGSVSITAVSQTPFSRGRADRGEPRLTPKEYCAWALEGLLKSTGLELKDLKGQGVGVMGSEYPHSEIWSPELVQDLGLEPKVLVRADQGGTNAAALVIQGALMIHSGYIDHFLIVGADSPLLGGPGPTWDYDTDFMRPFGYMGPVSVAAQLMRRYMHESGARPEHFGKVAVTERLHASLNPMAYFRTPMSVEDYLNSRVLSDPLRMFDVTPFVNGGFAILFSSSRVARQVSERPVPILGFGEYHNYREGRPFAPEITTTGVKVAAAEAYKMSGTSPKEIDNFHPYDDFTVAVLMQIEDARFAEKGKAPKFLDENDISYKGNLPVNTSGGLLSAGQAGMACGCLHIVEAVMQLRGECGERQVKGARRALVTAVGGIGYHGHFVNAAALILGAE